MVIKIENHSQFNTTPYSCQKVDCIYLKKVEKYLFYGLSYSTEAVKELDCFKIPQVSG